MAVYKNGNTIVLIKSDGTKIRYTPDNVIANPQFPESIDLKITNCCSVGCPACHECSTPDGAHGNLDHPILDSLKPYTELAIGGGDPMSHPGLEAFLKKMKDKEVFCNITVHWTSFRDNYPVLKRWTKESLIHGLGISINEVIPEEIIDKITEFPLAVVHSIIGVANPPVFAQLVNRNLNILLLGYKTFGRGVGYKQDNSESVGVRMNWVHEHIRKFPEKFRTVAFDNKAIDQVFLKEMLDPETFDRIYMGNDGSFTMYVDLVKGEYAASSVSPRKTIDSNDITKLFETIKTSGGSAF